MATSAREGPSTATIFRIVFTAAAALLILYGIYLIRSLLLLVLIAAFLAVGMDPAVRQLQKWGLRRGLAIGAILLSVVATLVGFLAAVVPPLVDQVTEFAADLPRYVQDLAQRNPQLEEYVDQQEIAARLEKATSDAPNNIGSSIGSVLGVAGSVLASIFNGVTVIVLTIYFALSLQRIREGTLRLIPRSKRDRVQELADPILTKIGGYIAGNVAVSVAAGTASFIFLILAGVPYPVALALWVAIADLIPLVGATLGAVPAVIVAFFVSVPVGIAALIFFFIYQQFENYVVAPRVMTKAVDLSPAAVLLSALIGAALLGVVGVLMAVPAAAATKLIVQQVVVPEAEKA